jgi:hypothetical protein
MERNADEKNPEDGEGKPYRVQSAVPYATLSFESVKIWKV